MGRVTRTGIATSAVLAALAALVGFSTGSSRAGVPVRTPVAASGADHQWIIGSADLSRLRQVSLALAREMFDSVGSIVLAPIRAPSNRVPRGWRSLAGAHFADLAECSLVCSGLRASGGRSCTV